MADVKSEIIRLMYLKGEFLKYYRSEFSHKHATLIDDLARREWAFIPFSAQGTMKRHMAFASFDELKNYVSHQDTVPMHMYCSSALYNYPGAPTMDGKEWSGADLVFDLDADHIPGAEDMSYEAMLDKVKDEFITLVEEFLMGDFGFDRSEITLKFSGSRGYHAQVHSNDVLEFDQNMRRDIAEYIEGHNLPVYMKVNVIMNPQTKTTTHIPYNAEVDGVAGWKARSTRYLLRFLRTLAEMPRAKAIKELSAVKNLGRKRAAEFIDALHASNLDKIRSDRWLLALFSRILSGKKTLLNIIEHVHDMYRVHLDIPVTGDTHRLIRCPNSLHGKTSLCAKVFDISQMEGFMPLRDAIPEVFLKGNVTIVGLRNAQFILNDITYEIKADKKMEVETFAANFAIARGLAIPVV